VKQESDTLNGLEEQDFVFLTTKLRFSLMKRDLH